MGGGDAEEELNAGCARAANAVSHKHGPTGGRDKSDDRIMRRRPVEQREPGIQPPAIHGEIGAVNNTSDVLYTRCTEYYI